MRRLALFALSMLLASGCVFLQQAARPLTRKLPAPVRGLGIAVTVATREVVVREAPPELRRVIRAALDGNTAALVERAGPLAMKAVGQMIDASWRTWSDPQRRARRSEEMRRRRVGAMQLFYAEQCTTGAAGSPAGGAAGAAGGGRTNASDEAASLDSQAADLFARGEYAQAEPPLQRAAELRERKLGAEHADTARALNRLAVVQLARGDNIPAMANATRALEARDQLLARAGSADTPAGAAAALDVAESQSTIAAIYQSSGALTEAMGAARRALELRTLHLGRDHLCVAESENNLGELCHVRGDFGQATGLLQHALQVRRARLPAQHRDVAQSMGALASLYRTIGLYSRARDLSLQALAARRQLGPDHPDVAESLDDLGTLERITGDYVAAERDLRRALEIRQKRLARSLEEADSAGALAALYQALGDHRQAEPLYQRALSIRRERLPGDHPDIAESLNDLGGLFFAVGDRSRAESFYQQALDIRSRKLGADHPAVAASRSSLGDVYLAMGDPVRARRSYEAALAIRKARFGEDHPEAADSIERLAILDQRGGNLERAETGLRKALEIRKSRLGPQSLDVAATLQHLAALRVARGAPGDALPLIASALGISEQLLRGVGMHASESRMEAMLGMLRTEEELVYSLLREPAIAGEAAPLGMAVVLLRKGRSVDEAAAASRAMYHGLDEADQGRLDRLRTLRSQIAYRQLGGGAADPKETAALVSEADRLEEDLVRRSARLRARERLPGPTEIVARVAAAVPEGGALVEVIAFRPVRFGARLGEPRREPLRYMALVMARSGRPRAVDLGPGDAIDADVRALLAAITAPAASDAKSGAEALAATRASAQRLYGRVMAPLEPLLGGRRDLYLSLDGQLHLAPWAALHDGRSWLLDTHSLLYLTSGRDLLRGAERATPSATVAVLAQPVFASDGSPPTATASDAEAGARGLEIVADEQAGKSGRSEPGGQAAKAAASAGGLRLRSMPDPLLGTRQEAEAIRALLPSARVLLGRDATKPALLDVKAPGVLHVATHGLFLAPGPAATSAGERGIEWLDDTGGAQRPSEDNPLLASMLLLAGVAAPGDGVVQLQPGGLATALEMAGMNLWGTQLVVLSACETGRGDVRRLGQGVYGLRRALVVAGAETVVTSLWKVDDAATRDLMARYYERLLAGRGRGEAMREAAQAVRRTHPHVAYWASFIVIGRGDRLLGIEGTGNRR